jgi:hypothetical protein
MADAQRIALPQGIPYQNSDGELGVLSGRVTTIAMPSVPTSWVQRLHPLRGIWLRDELKQRASFLATRQHLTPFLVPHRFEGTTDPSSLNRAKLAYGVGLNAAYMQEIFGHIRATPAHPNVGRINQGEAETLGIRSMFKFIPYSWIEDFGRNRGGYRWIKIAETLDAREPDMKNDDTGMQRRHMLYELTADGRTRITRWDDNGRQIGTELFQTIKNTNSQPMLPFVEVKFGKHPDVNYMGTGMLMGLDDIVIDMFNLLTEIREAYRDAVFTFLKYRGPDPDGVRVQLKQGTRLVHTGDDTNSDLGVVGADGSEVEAGLSLLEVSLKNWSLSAKRRAMEQQEATQARSGVSIKAEFQLDLVPVMVSITEQLDIIETNAMFILAQIEGHTVQEANVLSIRREKDFQMEQEASRISRIVKEYMDAIPGMPAPLLKQMIMRWAESIDFLDLDAMVKMGDGSSKKLRDIIESDATDIAESDQAARMRANEFGILGPAAQGPISGGSNNGGGNPGGNGSSRPRPAGSSAGR